MPLLRINATTQGLRLHGSPQSVARAIAQAAPRVTAVVIMVHGYKYSPFITDRCPHGRIFSSDGWPAALGLDQRDTLGIAFGWHARGGLALTYGRALEQADQLAQVVRACRGHAPVHIIAHSLGATLSLAALPYLGASDLMKIVLLSGAAHLGLAQHALASPAGRTCDLFHVTSRENALFDFMFEQMIAGSGAIGRGLTSPRAAEIRIDCPDSLRVLDRLGYPLAPPQRKICHWSSYTRPGVMALNAALYGGLIQPEQLRAALPVAASTPYMPWPLVMMRKTRIIQASRSGKGPRHEHAY